MKQFKQPPADEIVDHGVGPKALRCLRSHCEMILNTVSDGVLALDADENIIFANAKAAELLGWSIDELLGHSVHSRLHVRSDDGNTYPIESCPIHSSMHAGELRSVKNDLFWQKNGRSFRVDYTCAPITDHIGRATGGIVIFKDITDAYVSDARLKLQAEQYRLLFETNPSPMWVFDTESLSILAVNEAALAQYDYSREEFLRLTLTDLQPANDNLDLKRALTRAARTTRVSGQFRHIRKDGSIIMVDVYSAPLVWEGVSARMVTAMDISGRKGAP